MSNAESTKTMEPKDSGKYPWRPVIGQFFCTIAFYGPFFGISGILLPAKIGFIDPANKVNLTATATTVTLIISVFAGIIFGALSDMTRSRFGARTPWLIGTSVVATVCLVIFAINDNTAIAMGAWFIYTACYSAMMSAGMAWMHDLIPEKYRGSASSSFGIATQIGLNGFQSLCSLFVASVGDVSNGVFVTLVIADIAMIIAVIVTAEPSNKDVPPVKMDLSAFKQFLPPTHAGRDYWFACLSRLLYMLPGGIGTYRLYTLTDWMHTSAASAASWMALMSLLSLIFAVLMSALSGPVSMLFKGGMKIPAAVGMFLVGVPCWLPLIVQTPLMYTIYVALSGIGGGLFIAIDQSLMTSVLPNPDQAAKDLSFINAMGTVGQMLAPLLGAWVFHMFGYAGLFPMGFIVLTLGALSILGMKNVK
ncbi:MFS transporter [Bifidobacterium sp. SO4]|uniref:MFS transporter n=1 Tax=Bifidobacterium sp. SO4 TaxID=2809030 RepID=UPI001BDD4238|nr:MFS transporter [Bifidobacterium sp. SO4]MBT1170361.1 MFS transporter [Bifidobacterium sp. SO4]